MSSMMLLYLPPDYALVICALREVYCKRGLGCEMYECSVASGVMGVRSYLMGGREVMVR